MSYSTWPRLAQIYRAIADGDVKVIGWGAGGQLRRHYRTAHYPLSYIIDSNPALIGSRFLGREVRAPQSLLDEDPAKVAVLVGPTRSHRQEIADQIAAMGPYDVITPYCAELAERFCLALGELDAAPLSRKPPASSSNGIVVQGPYDPAGTLMLMRILASQYPQDWIVWSTWVDTPSEVLALIRPWCDSIVLNQLPPNPGKGNSNLQRETTLSGLKWLRMQGVDLALKVRSDGVPLAPDVFSRGRALYSYLAVPPPAKGLRRRIIISNVFTFAHIPFHISDIVQMGDIADLEALWSFPDDIGVNADPDDPHGQSMSLADLSRARLTGETQIGHQLAAIIGVDIDYSLTQYLEVVRDNLIVVDQQWFDVFLPKYHPTSQTLFIRTPSVTKDLIDFQTWMALQSRDPALIKRATGAIDVDRHCWLDLFSGVGL